MPLDSEFGALSTLVKIVFVDLLLSGDNAVVIALACRGLPPLQARQALLFGTGAAILLRVVLAALATVLLYVPFLKLAGGGFIDVSRPRKGFARAGGRDSLRPLRMRPARGRCEARVPANHPLRAIRAIVDEALEVMSPAFEGLYSKIGRPSIPPEKLLRALLPQAFCSVRSGRQLMEQFDYNLLFRLDRRHMIFMNPQ